MHHGGHGDVVGDGERTVYIARVRQNHFVPLIPQFSESTSATGSKPGAPGCTGSDAASSTASGSVAPSAGGAREKPKSAESAAPGCISCNDMIADNNVARSTILHDMV